MTGYSKSQGQSQIWKEFLISGRNIFQKPSSTEVWTGEWDSFSAEVKVTTPVSIIIERQESKKVQSSVLGVRRSESLTRPKSF